MRRNNQLLFRPHYADALDIVSGRVVGSDLGARHRVWLQQLDIALRRSNRIRHLHPGLHSESRDLRAAGFLQSGPIEAGDRCHCRRAFAAQPFPLFLLIRRNR